MILNYEIQSTLLRSSFVIDTYHIWVKKSFCYVYLLADISFAWRFLMFWVLKNIRTSPGSDVVCDISDVFNNKDQILYHHLIMKSRIITENLKRWNAVINFIIIWRIRRLWRMLYLCAMSDWHNKPFLLWITVS